MHDEIMRQVQNLPKVREAMEHLGGLLKAGELSVNDLEDAEKLKALAVDPAAAKYWKDYWGQGDQGSKQFGGELVQEFAKKQAKASLDEEKAKMRRAYDIALEMQEKGMISDDPSTLHAQVDEIMKFDNKAFESYKLAISRVAKPAAVKTAAPAINVGVNSEDIGSGSSEGGGNMVDQLKKLW
jgi:hypothetical protein